VRGVARKGGFPHELAVIDRHNDSLAARPASCSLGRMQAGMKSMNASPYGFWMSPLTSDLVADSIRLEQVALDGDAIYWTETQPQKQGRTFVSLGVGSERRSARQLVDLSEKAGVNLGSQFTFSITMANFSAGPRRAKAMRVLLVSGDDTQAKRIVMQLIEALGFAAIDLGGLLDGGRK
jgi:hypothetical protein